MPLQSHSPALCWVSWALPTRGTAEELEVLHSFEHGLSGQISKPHLKPAPV